MLSIYHIHKVWILISTIFKTVQDLTTGKTKITPSGFLGGMFSGDFFKAQSIVSEEDIKALEAYNASLANTKPVEAFDKTMKNASTTAQNLAKSAKGAAVDINAIPKVSKAAAAGMKLLSGAMNIAATMIISYLISGIYKMIGAYEEMSQQAADATAKYKEQSSSLDEYKGKVTELKTALSSENLTYAEARDKRSQLLDIQKQLIDTYGAEASGIDLINGSLEDQVEKLEKLNKQKRQEWENEVNKETAGQWWQKWAGWFGLALFDTVTLDWTFFDADKWLENFENKTNIERITEKVENFKKSISLSDLDLDAEKLETLKTQMDSYDGVSFNGNEMTIAGDAKTVAETVTKIQTEVIGSREDLQGLNQDLKDVYNSANKIVTANWDTYNQALENKILDDDKGLGYYGKLTDAYETYQEALKDGDNGAINKAKEGYAALLSDINNSDMDASFKKYFENMYPDISDIIDDWKFEVKIEPKIISNEEGLKDSINNIEGLTTDEIKAAFDNNGIGVTKDQWKAITDLNAEAQANGLDLSTFLGQLREAGYLVSQLDKNIEKTVGDAKTKYGDGVDWSKYFKDNSIDTEEDLDTWHKVTKNINNAEEAMNAYAKATKSVDKTTTSLAELEKASDNIKPLGNAFKELSDDGYITIKTLKEMQAASDLSGEEWSEYESKLLRAKVGSSEFNQVMSELTYKILDNTFANVDLNDTTEQYIISVLRGNGVVNASAVAHDWLTKAKAKEKIASMELVKGSNLDIAALTSEAAACGVAKNAYLELVAKEIVFNRNDLDVEDKIKKLNQIAAAAGVAGINMDVLNSKFSSNTEKQKYLQEKGFTITTTSKSASSTNNWITGNGFFGDKSTFSVPSTQSIEYTSPDGTKYSSLDEAIYNEYAMDQIGGLMERMSGATSNITIPNYSGAAKDSGSDKNDALDNYLKDAENRYKIHQDETKYIQELQYAYANLTKNEKERLDITGKINEAYRDLADNRIKDIEHQIDLAKELNGENVDVTTYYDQIQTVASEEANRLRNLGYDDNSNEIQDLQKTWWSAQNSKLDFYSKQHENIIRDIEHARDMVLEKNPFEDTRSFYTKMQEEYHKEAERLRSLDPEKYKEEIQEYQKKWWDAEQSKVDWEWGNSNNWINDRNTYNDWDLFGDSEVEAWERVIKWLNEDYPQELDKINEAEKNLFEARKRLVDDLLNEIQDETNKTYDIRISRLNSQSSLLSKHFGLVNSITEEQHTLNKELKEAETIGAKMNEQERKTLFTKEDHVRLSGKLNDIMLDITDLQGDYIRDLETATEDTIEEITNQYERQYDLKMKEYEIVKAELSVMKAQQVLENTENEKSVRTWSGSGWVYEANLQNVLKAQEELEDAKYSVTKAKTDEAQQKAINAIEANADALQTEKNKLTSAIEDMAEKMEGSGKDITSMLSTIAKTDLPTFDAIINTLGGSIKKALGMSDDDINKVRFEGASGLPYEYATGTKHANKGVGLFDENGFGSELILTNGGILTQFNGGERVFSSDMADRLWEFSKNGGIFSHTLQQISSGKLLPIEDKISNIISNMSNISGDTYMIKDVQLSESEGGTLKGFIDFLKKKV